MVLNLYVALGPEDRAAARWEARRHQRPAAALLVFDAVKLSNIFSSSLH